MRSLLCRGWGVSMGYQLTKRFVVKRELLESTTLMIVVF